MSYTMRVDWDDAERLKQYAEVYEPRARAVHRVLALAERVTDEDWLCQVLEAGLGDADSAHLGGLVQVPTHEIARILARAVASAARDAAFATPEGPEVSDGRDRDSQPAG
jgi:predicted transcriptional regulator